MARIEYKYNPKSLRYEKIVRNIPYWFRRSMLFTISGLLFGAVIYTVAYIFLPSLKERHLIIENAQLKNQYEIMNERLNLALNVQVDIQERDDNIYRTIYGAEAIPQNVRQGGIGGVNRYDIYEGYENSELVISTVKKLDRLSKNLVIQSKSFDEVLKLAKNKSKMMESIPAVQPIRNKDLTRFASGYGIRTDPILKIKRMHWGVDFTAPTGTEIYATGNGRVRTVKASSTGWGRHVILDHGFGYQTIYGHMIRFNVKQGQKVKRGDIIGYVGNTGRSTGPHLHYEVKKRGRNVNPSYFFHNDLNEEQFEQMIKISSRDTQSFD